MRGTRLRTRLTHELTVRRLRKLGVDVDDEARFVGTPLVFVASSSTIRIGARAMIVSTTARTAIGLHHPVVLRTVHADAIIEIGDDVGMSGGTICAAMRVTIGSGTLLGANVTIVDTNFHPTFDEARRYAPMPAPKARDAVDIGCNVFIGTGAIILKGTTIGSGAVVGAGAVVRGRVEPDTVVIGNPARPFTPAGG